MYIKIAQAHQEAEAKRLREEQKRAEAQAVVAARCFPLETVLLVGAWHSLGALVSLQGPALLAARLVS